ncbi:MAG: TlyA family RNA methyltransferase [Pseudomonadota bacterium]|nr:TlyA family RNA methyltransferase [Pseudomonadota bacterium]
MVERGLADDTKQAQALILSGKVFAADRRIDKPGTPVSVETPLEVRGHEHPWVSRGGLKLDHALDHFGIDVLGSKGLDIGASTGGFTDVLLTRGAAGVFAVDVGYGQIHWKLRSDDRVVVLDRTNARQLTRDRIPDPVDIVVCDASFTRLATVLPVPMSFAGPGAHLVALIKPQFEVSRVDVGEGGVVRDPALHDAVCNNAEDWLGSQACWSVIGIERSPVTGAEGNVEFLIAARRDG